MKKQIVTSDLLWGLQVKIIKGEKLKDNERKYLASYLFMAAELEQKGALNVEAKWRLDNKKENEIILEKLDLSTMKFLAEQNNAEIEFKRFFDAKKKARGHADELVSAHIELVKKTFNESQNNARKIVAEKMGIKIESVTTMHKRYMKKLKKSD